MKRIAFIITVMAGVLFCACNDNTKVNIRYGYSERYNIGDATIEQPVNSINIDWVAGVVKIRYADSNVFRIREESDSILIDSLRMRYHVSDDGELEIKFCQSGSYHSGRLVDINKWLVVEVPHDTNLDKIDINMVGGLLDVDSVYSRELGLDVVSVATTVWTPLADEIDVRAVSSTLRLYVPPTAGITVAMNGISNELNCELPVRKDGKKTVIGDGRCKVDIDAVKGSVYINEIPKQ